MTNSYPRLLVNRWKHRDGTILQSHHRHDFVEYNGCFVDGGLDYIRVSGDLTDLCLYEDSPFDEIRKYFCWGTKGIDGREPLKYVPLVYLDEDHIKAIIETQYHVPDYIMNLLKKELKYRKNNES